MHEKPICDLNSLNLTHSIFDFVLGVVERKLLRQQQQQVAATTSSGSAQRNGGRYYQLPQLGPLIMDVAVQRQTVIRKVRLPKNQGCCRNLRSTVGKKMFLALVLIANNERDTLHSTCIAIF